MVRTYKNVSSQQMLGQNEIDETKVKSIEYPATLRFDNNSLIHLGWE